MQENSIEDHSAKISFQIDAYDIMAEYSFRGIPEELIFSKASGQFRDLMGSSASFARSLVFFGKRSTLSPTIQSESKTFQPMMTAIALSRLYRVIEHLTGCSTGTSVMFKARDSISGTAFHLTLTINDKKECVYENRIMIPETDGRAAVDDRHMGIYAGGTTIRNLYSTYANSVKRWRADKSKQEQA